MFKNKIDITSKYLQVQAMLLIENIEKSEDYRREIKKFIKNIQNMPHETIKEVARIKYSMDDYVIGARLNSEVKLVNNGRISEEEVDAARLFAKYLDDNNIANVELNTGSLSYCSYAENMITIGCNILPLKKILKKSLLAEIIVMTYLHEEGHRQDTKKIREILKLDKLIEKYGKETFRDNKSKKKVYIVTIPDRIFKRICMESVKAEFRAWEYARMANEYFKINKEDFEIYRLWALYNYVNSHHKNMIKREIKIIDYVFRSDRKQNN